MHLHDEQIQQLLDRDLASPITQEAREHLAGCAQCQLRLATAEQEDTWLSERLGLLDHAIPPVSLGVVVARARGQRPAWKRVAAGILLAVATAGVAYAVPGSPVPRWIVRIVRVVRPEPRVDRNALPLEVRPTSQAGIAVAPGKRFVIELSGDNTLDSAFISLTDAAELRVQARGGTTSFASDVGRLGVIHTGGPGNLAIEVPRTAPWVELRVGARRLWLKDRAAIRSDLTADESGQYRVPLR
jgi:hypothetical protein